MLACDKSLTHSPQKLELKQSGNMSKARDVYTQVHCLRRARKLLVYIFLWHMVSNVNVWWKANWNSGILLRIKYSDASLFNSYLKTGTKTL